MEPLLDNEVRVFFLRTEEAQDSHRLTSFANLLAPDEITRMQRFVRAENRHEYLVAHAMLRMVLSRFAPIAPSAWVFGRQQHGRPIVAEPADFQSLFFSLSHCQGLVACVVARGTDVGVDVEAAGRTADSLSVAERFFSPTEIAQIRACPTAEQETRFLALWTLKEAYLKARGLGLALPLDGFSFILSEPSTARVSFSSIADEATNWQFARAQPSPSHTLSVAVRVGVGAPAKIRIEPFGSN